MIRILRYVIPPQRVSRMMRLWMEPMGKGNEVRLIPSHGHEVVMVDIFLLPRFLLGLFECGF